MKQFLLCLTLTLALILTTQQVSTHATKADCWIVIHQKVYDVTSYIVKHLAEKDVITPYCGKVADTGWDTKDKGKPHSRAAERLLNRYQIGDLSPSQSQ